MALNFIHANFRPVPLCLLGRNPTATHLAIYKRLSALLTACDRPELHPLPPGRSGFEFVARLVELEHFAGPNPSFNLSGYEGEVEQNRSTPLKAGVIGDQHKFQVSQKFSPIRPYRSLDASRLKLSGTGAWNLEEYLDSVLWLPYVEPGILLHHNEVSWSGPSFEKESYEENLQLAKLWDARGLLAPFSQPHASGLACRVFNAHKNELLDRQIGDRRWLNGAEYHPSGPSAKLPSGATITSIHCPRGFTLIGCASDRKDFYHQARVSRARAHSNLLPFKFPSSAFEASPALEELAHETSRKTDQKVHGDRLGLAPRPILARGDISTVYAGFNSIFQGDHLGVEYALESHTNFLQNAGLLDPASHVLRHQPFPAGPVWQGVVIDDYFAVSREPLGKNKPTAAAVELLEIAEDAYRRHDVLGSDEKTVRGAEVFKVIGAEVLSDKQCRDAGVVLVGAPASKRIPLSALSFRAAKLPVISRGLASRIAGNWVSVFMFRRSLCCVLQKIFGLGTRLADDANDVVALPRKVAEELVLAGVFGLVSLSDVSVPYDSRLFATDASSCKGAFTAKEVGLGLAQTIWLGGDRKDAYTMLDNPARRALRSVGCDRDDEPIIEDLESPSKSLDFAFDAVEVCGGSGVLSKALCNRGLIVCTPIDISNSRHYDITDLKLLNWIFQMIAEGRFKAVIVEPVCTTFSPAQHPASRSYANPLGFDRKDPKTLLGNTIAFRCLAIMWFAWRWEILALLEQPQLSKMAWLSFWKFLLSLGFEEAIINSCAFGSIHRKPFRWLGYGLPMHELNTPCPGSHPHVRIEGKYTKTSSIYHPELAKFLALKIHQALLARATFEEKWEIKLESVILNDVLLQDGWKVLGAWEWKQAGHINVLESRSYVALLRHLVLEGGDVRFSTALDSRVAKGAHAKGRSSSEALRPSLCRACALTIAGNLHQSFGFAQLGSTQLMLQPEISHSLSPRVSRFWIFFQVLKLLSCTRVSSLVPLQGGYGSSSLLLFALVLAKGARFRHLSLQKMLLLGFVHAF